MEKGKFGIWMNHPYDPETACGYRSSLTDFPMRAQRRHHNERVVNRRMHILKDVFRHNKNWLNNVQPGRFKKFNLVCTCPGCDASGHAFCGKRIKTPKEVRDDRVAQEQILDYYEK